MKGERYHANEEGEFHLKKKKIQLSEVTEAAIKKTIGTEAYTAIVDAKNSEMITLLLGVYAERVARLEAPDILKQANENRFAQRSEIDQRRFLEFDLAFFSELDDDIEVVELSPVAPLGSNAVLAGLSQHNVLSANRNVEIVADAVTSLAIECAKKG